LLGRQQARAADHGAGAAALPGPGRAAGTADEQEAGCYRKKPKQPLLRCGGGWGCRHRRVVHVGWLGSWTCTNS